MRIKIAKAGNDFISPLLESPVPNARSRLYWPIPQPSHPTPHMHRSKVNATLWQSLEVTLSNLLPQPRPVSPQAPL